MGNLDQHAGAVAGLRITPASPAVRQVDQDFDPFQNDVMGFFAGDVGHKADPTSIMLVARIVKALRFRQTLKVEFIAHVYPIHLDTMARPICVYSRRTTQPLFDICLLKGCRAPTLTTCKTTGLYFVCG